MSRLFLAAMMIIALAFFGCGEQADEASGDTGGENGEVTSDSGGEAGGDVATDGGGDAEDTGDQGDDHGAGDAADLDFQTPDMEVGQWIEYGADQMPQTVTFSVVGSEMNQGTECLWVQISTEGFVAQLLVDPEGMEDAMEGYEEQFGDFTADPEGYIRENMADAQGMASLFGNEESMETMLELVRAIRIIKFEQQGMVMAVDLAGVPEWLEEMLQDPAIQESFQEGFAQGFNAEGGQEGLNTMMAELDNMDFEWEETAVDVAGENMMAYKFSIAHPEGQISAVLSGDLPLLPLAYAEVTGEGETHYVEVRGFGFEGAEDLMPGEPAQTIQAMMMLQGMEQQLGAMAGGQGMQ